MADARPGDARASRRPARSPSTTATTSAPRPRPPAWRTPSTSRASCRPSSGRCSARARVRSAGPRSRAIRTTSSAPTRPSCELFPEDAALRRWIEMAEERVPFQGLPARICWLGYGERARAGLRFNELVRTGAVSRAHRHRPRPPRRRLGRLAQPRDRSDAGRLGRDRRLAAAERAGQHRRRRDVGVDPPRRRRRASATRSTPAWSSSPTAPTLAAQKLERVLTTDPGMGVIRHADAGYERAIEVARERGVRIPMPTPISGMCRSKDG